MRFLGQVFAFGGIVIASGAVAQTAHAQAFGQQWRPVAAYSATAPAPHYRQRRIANMPSFRPRTTVTPPRYVASSRASARQPAPRSVASHYRPMPLHAAPMLQPYRHPVGGLWSAMPMWANPFAQFGQVWQQPMPMFTRQLGAPPARQPWHADSPHRSYRAPRTAASFSNAAPSRYTTPRARPFGQTWRPTRFTSVSRTFLPSQRSVASYRPVQHADRVALQPTQWRPQHAGSATFAAVPGFRPAAYGRGARYALAKSDAQRVRSDANGLPGFATTYQDPVGQQGCLWCSGS